MSVAERRAWRDGIDPADLPYGPGNPDYEHDGARQRADDEYDADETEARAEEERRNAAKRASAGMSPEILFLKEQETA